MTKDLDVTVYGWVGATPYDGRRGGSGQSFTSFPIMHTPRYRDSQGNWQNGETVSVRAKGWGKLADNIIGSIERGNPVIATGRMGVEHWTDTDGKERTDIILRLTSIGHDLTQGKAAFTRIKKQPTEAQRGDEGLENPDLPPAASEPLVAPSGANHDYQAEYVPAYAGSFAG